MEQIDRKVCVYRLAIIIITFVYAQCLGVKVGLSQEQKIQKLTVFKKQMQEKVAKISQQLVKSYSDPCLTSVLNCQIKSFNMCDGTSTRVCLNNFPTPTGCLNQGLWVSSTSAVRVPNIFQTYNLNTDARRFICSSALVQPIFDQLRINNTIQYSYAYIGSSSGAIRVAPAHKQKRGQGKKCIDYDPRIRPWYVSAITGSKNTIVLLDISKTMTSMHPGVRFRNAKITLQIIFQTLNSFDYICVVAFSKTAKSLKFDKIVNANKDNKKSIMDVIDTIEPQDGFTNYTAAIQKGMNMLQNVSTLCSQTVFLLLTDGHTQNDQPQNVNNISILINKELLKLNKTIDSLRLISFVYGIQNNINYTIARELTCIYSGIVFRMWDGIDNLTMIQKLTSYYVFLSEFISDKTKVKPLWSQVYEDAFGFGMIVSVTYPVFIDNRVPKIIGVAAIDVLLSKFQQEYGFTLQQIQTELRDIPQCFKSTLQANQLTFLRCKQGNLTCLAGDNDQQVCNDIKTNVSDKEKCAQNISYSVFYDNVIDGTDDDDKCCGITLRTFYAILFSILGAIVFLIIIGILYWKGSFHFIYNKLCKKSQKIRIQTIHATTQSISSEPENLNDPKNKYKDAQVSGIRIYYQEKFQF